ncbi:MAG: NAD-dependent protein deacylase [Polyangiales bacterium]
MTPVAPLDLDGDARLVVMTGAGVSAESGIPTFRDANGLWEQHRFEDVASPEGFAADPRLVWRFYSVRREKAAACAPNAGHVALADVERRLGDRFLLVTQNVDGLHRRAGSRRLVELHGNLFTSRCSRPRCTTAPFRDEALHLGEALPTCAACGALLRPHIVWFGESLAPEDLQRFEDFLLTARRDAAPLVYVAAGTSGAVQPAAGLVHAARCAGARTVLVNLERPDNVDAFERVHLGRSGEVLPRLLG